VRNYGYDLLENRIEIRDHTFIASALFVQVDRLNYLLNSLSRKSRLIDERLRDDEKLVSSKAK